MTGAKGNERQIFSITCGGNLIKQRKQIFGHISIALHFPPLMFLMCWKYDGITEGFYHVTRDMLSAFIKIIAQFRLFLGK